MSKIREGERFGDRGRALKKPGSPTECSEPQGILVP